MTGVKIADFYVSLHLANLGITTRVNFDKSDMVVMTDFKIFMDNGKEFFQEIHLAG